MVSSEIPRTAALARVKPNMVTHPMETFLDVTMRAESSTYG
jgi:hypothetical protein